MGNGYGVVGTFLFGPAEYIEREQSYPNGRTSTI
jgi:hypothetical protein